MNETIFLEIFIVTLLVTSIIGGLFSTDDINNLSDINNSYISGGGI